jgi:hypothetical protein
MSLSSEVEEESKSYKLWVGDGSGRVTKPMTAKVAVVAKRRYKVFLMFGAANSLFDIFDDIIL